MRELGVALGQMHDQADLGRQDTAMGSWAQLESICSIRGQDRTGSRSEPWVLWTGVFIPNWMGVATQRAPGHMRKHKLTRHVHPTEYENTQHSVGNPMSNHSWHLALMAPAIQGTRDHANLASRHRIGTVKCKGSLIPWHPPLDYAIHPRTVYSWIKITIYNSHVVVQKRSLQISW